MMMKISRKMKTPESLKFLVSGLILLFICQNLRAQITVFEKPAGKGKTWICARNENNIPYTIILHLKLKNMKTATAMPSHFIVPASNTGFELIELVAGKGKYSYQIQYETFKGITTGHHHNDKYVYGLPVKGKCKIIQGYYGKFSHIDKKAIDFGLPMGSDVIAAREGLVLEIKSDGKHSCLDPGCEKEGNFVKILHDDGSVASYYHLKHNGCLVKPGQKIAKGQVIAISGNNGYSSEPHLHFEVYTLLNKSKHYPEISFDNGSGNVINGASFKPKN